jgi:hypothetical protein
MNLRNVGFYMFMVVFLLHMKVSATSGTRDVPLNESDNELFLATERSIPESWYSRLLDLSMHIWADFDMLQRGGNTLLPDHMELVFDASIGKLVHLNWCLDQMIRHKKGEIAYDDVRYFVQIMEAVSKYCNTIVAQSPLAHKAESTQEIVRIIMEKMDAAFLR